MRTESNTRGHPALEPPSAPDGKSTESAPHVRESRLILPAAAAFVAVLLAAACSFDASRLRTRRIADSGVREADATEIGVTQADARDTDATEVDALLDHPLYQDLAVQDSFVEVGADGASAMSEVGDVAEAGGSVEDAGDAPADLPLGTGGSFDTGGAGGTGGEGGMFGSDGPTATADTDGTFDTGAPGDTDGGATDGMPGSDGAAATDGADGAVDTGGAGGTGGVPGSDGAAATGGADGAVDAGGAGGTGGGGTGGMAGFGGATATGGTGGSVSPPAGLVAWWKMDEATGSDTAADASGNGNNATLSGLSSASAWTTGRTGGALKCDGSGGALVDDSASLDRNHNRCHHLGMGQSTECHHWLLGGPVARNWHHQWSVLLVGLVGRQGRVLRSFRRAFDRHGPDRYLDTPGGHARRNHGTHLRQRLPGDEPELERCLQGRHIEADHLWQPERHQRRHCRALEWLGR